MLWTIAPVARIQEQAGIPASLLFLGGVVGASAVTFVIFGGAFASTLFGMAFPIYASYKAIESPAKEDDNQWLAYWVFFGAFTLIESFDDIFTEYLPFYYALKVGIFVYLFAPNTNGADFVYKTFIRPLIVTEAPPPAPEESAAAAAPVEAAPPAEGDSAAPPPAEEAAPTPVEEAAPPPPE